MVLLNRIYTRTGDAGLTRLADGSSVSKTGVRVSAYGEVDELNAVIGLARLNLGKAVSLDALLARIQNDLFDLGADLATPAGDGHRQALRIVASQVDRLEGEIDTLNQDLAPLTSFVLPGGAPAAAWLHLARTVCRRAERAAVRLLEADTKAHGEKTPHANAIRYLNRLSDLLFVAARFANAAADGDVLWAPGANR